MAEDEVIILEEEEEEKEQSQEEAEAEEEVQKKARRKKLIIFGGAGGGGVLLILLIVILLFFGEEEPVPEGPDTDAAEIASRLLEEKRKTVKLPELEMMIRKANMFYARGDKKEALELFETISGYSEAISSYNLGVAQMQDNNCEGAIESFQRAIDIGEDRCLSAINAAVCAYRTGQNELFHYYIDLAEAYLPFDGNDPLFAYQYALVNYYKHNYFEALSPLLHPTSPYYEDQKNHLMSKIFLLYNDDYNAITYLEKTATGEDYLPLGLLYARIGEYSIASSYIVRYIDAGYDSIEARMALALIDIKKGNFGDTAGGLSLLDAKYQKEATRYYPVSVKLKDTLFDINLAQERFKKEFIDQETAAKVIFYFASYKVFNAKEALAFIKKGGVNIFIDEIRDAENVLIQGSTISRVNKSIAKAISKALDHRVRDANEFLLRVVDSYPNHAILHYNLALSYAQIGQFDMAYKHFLKSYHLDNRDVMPGVFAMICARLIHRDYGRILDNITEDLDVFQGDEKEQEFLLALINFFQGNVTSTLPWFESEKPQKPIYLAFDNLIAHASGNTGEYLTVARKLKQLYPRDVVVGVFEQLALHGHKSVKDFAAYTQSFFKTDSVNLDSIYYGPGIARELYIKMGYISGTLHFVKDVLKERMLTERLDARGVMQAMALTNIYTRDFEESYVIYNTLIDELGVKDTSTLFLAAVAAIGAGHNANAIALLELSKITDPTNRESRFALGLLYQEAKNLKSASTQYALIGNTGFQSEYFDFYIDTENKIQLN